MSEDGPCFSAAAERAAPTRLGCETTFEKACDVIRGAARRRPRFVAFPATPVSTDRSWVPGGHSGSGDLVIRLSRGAVDVPGIVVEGCGRR